MKFQGTGFVSCAFSEAHAASVPMVVYLDPQHGAGGFQGGAGAPFNSVMVANAKGIAMDAEMGRLESEEDGRLAVDMESTPHAARAGPEIREEYGRPDPDNVTASALDELHGPGICVNHDNGITEEETVSAVERMQRVPRARLDP
ncbi:hypothetical protein VUR80DRAFT_1287 [Thermomyces stellatus]